jgi:xanthine dehydrogenase molybdenum-binding subunit
VADTVTTPQAPLTAGSTVTVSAGLAAQRAARDLKAKLLSAAADRLDLNPDEIEIADGAIRLRSGQSRMLSLADLYREADGEGLSVDVAITPGSADYVVNSFGAHFAEVEVDTVTGNVKVLRYVAAHDSGRIINPVLATNQVEGAVSQMLAFTLTEQMITDQRTGITINGSFLEHKGVTALDYPNVQVIFADVIDLVGPFGAKALGEPPSIGVAPAVVSAIRDAVGITVTNLPASPDKIINLLSQGERR